MIPDRSGPDPPTPCAPMTPPSPTPTVPEPPARPLPFPAAARRRGAGNGPLERGTWFRLLRIAAVLAAGLLGAGCGGDEAPADGERADGTAGAVAFTGATIWDGTGAPPVPGATLLVRDGRVVSVEPAGSPPEGVRVVDVGGRWIVPGLVDGHAHVSGHWAPDTVAGDSARMVGDLLLYARYGVTTVNSLGGEPMAAGAVRAAGEGAAPGHARLRFAGEVVTGPTPEEARAQVTGNAERDADWIKLRVDDNLGTTRKMPWTAVEATLAEAEARGIPVATHVFYLEDARRLLEMGTDLVAHSVRDRPVDEGFAQALRERNVCYVPTLTREITTFAYADEPSWLDDPFFRRWADEDEVAAVTDPEFRARMAESPAAARYREGLVQAQENLATLERAGAPLAFGTDAGPATRFPGFLQHLELELMVEAGLSPARALEVATRETAACLGLDGVGTLEPGRWADFLVLGGDPLESVAATRTLEAVYVGGAPIP